MQRKSELQLSTIIEFKTILYIGLILSETLILVNIKFYTTVYFFPYFTLAYFILSTSYLLFAFSSYAFFANRSRAWALEVFEHLGLPISVLFFTLLTRNNELIGVKAVGVILMIMQSLLITIKIIYFGSLFPEVAHISVLNKLSRLLKLNVISLLPLVVSSHLIVASTVAACQLASIGAFFLKFTYQRLDCEYLLLAGIFCGTLSAVESIFEAIFGLGYLFFGELTSLFFYFQQDNYLRTLIEIKHIHNCQSKAEGKHDDDHLAAFLFINECLFPTKQFIPLSKTAKSEGIAQAAALVDRLTGLANAKGPCDDQIIQSQVHHESYPLLLSLLEAYYSSFHETTSFPAFQFLVGSALHLGGSFVNRALVMFYSHAEREGKKKSVFQVCKYQYLYHRIRARLQTRESDREEIRYIQFSDRLAEVNQEIEACFTNELRMVEYLSESDNKSGFQTADHLVQRHKMKRRIRGHLQDCFSKEVYFNSNEFKFLFILYEVTIERRAAGLRELLKAKFLASEVQRLREENKLKSLVVLSGFSHGEIVNSNESFKKRFGFSLSSASRSNIAEFFPSERQKAKHAQLMVDFLELKAQSGPSHDSYQCLLGLQQEVNAIKLKTVENFVIGVRIYYEHQDGFNYICNLAKREREGEQASLLLLRRDCDMLISKNLRFTLIANSKTEQLGETIELCEVSFYVSQHSIKDSVVAKVWQRKERRESAVLEEKAATIEIKMIEGRQEGCKYTFASLAELLLFLVMAILLAATFVSIFESVETLRFTVLQKHEPVAYAQLLRNRIVMEQEILSFIYQTSYFPNDICERYGIPNISDYIIKILRNDLINSTDQFRATTMLPSSGDLDAHLYVRQFSPTPYFKAYPLLISYQKYIGLLKANTFVWFSTLSTAVFNTNFYAQTFPNILLKGTLDASNSLSALLNADQTIYTSNLISRISYLKVMACVGVGVIGLLLALLRLWDNLSLVDYLAIVQGIREEILSARARELKSALGQLHRLRANYIKGVQFDPEYIVSIRSDKNNNEDVPLADFADWHQESRQDSDLEESGCAMENKQLLDSHEAQGDTQLEQSRLVRVMLYLRFYLVLLAGAVAALSVLTGGILDMEEAYVKTITHCQDASMSVLGIQQKVINMVGYNWLKVLSLHQPLNMTAASNMFNEAVDSLLHNPYQEDIKAAYTRDFADRVLNGNVCKYFANSKLCSSYRNGLFGSGFSMLVPFMLKEELEIDNISDDPSYYTRNMCDKTWLLFEGVIPMTTQIPQRGYSLMLDAASSGLRSIYLEVGMAGLALLGVTVIWQCLRMWREAVVREEALSLDTVDSLYSMAEFKPHFNRVYYS